MFLIFVASLLPLISSSLFNLEFELPKFIFILTFIFGVYGLVRAYEIVKNGVSLQIFKTHKIFFITMLLYFLYLIFSTIFVSLSPAFSFWGTFQRQSGLLLFLGLAYLFLMFVTVRHQKKSLPLFFTGLGFAGTIVSIIGLAQYFNGTDLAQTLGRIYSTLGQPNFLGQFLLLSIPATLFVLLRGQLPRILGYLSIALQISALVFSGNRASLLALLILSVVVGAGVVMKRNTIGKHAVYGVFTVAIVGVLSLGAYFIKDPAVFTRSLETRVNLFPSAVSMIMKRPLTGYGLENFGFAYLPFHNEKIFETENFSNTPDKAHNEILDILAEQGFVGLLFLAVLVFYLLKKSLPLMLRVCEEQFPLMILWSMVASSFLSHMAGFASLTEKVVMVIMSGYILLLVNGEKEEKVMMRFRFIPAVFMVIISGLFFWCGYRVGYADILDVSAKNEFTLGNVEKSRDEMRVVEHVALFPYEYLLFGSYIFDNAKALEVVNGLQKVNKYDLYIPLMKGDILKSMGDEGLAVNEYTSGLGICPKCPRFYERLGLMTGEKVYLEKYVELLPTFMKKPDSELTLFEKDRKRIFLKEQKWSYEKVMEAIKYIETH